MQQGSKVEQIGYRAFRNCTSLSDINWPGNIRKLEADAFINCTSLTRVELSGRLEEMASSVFEDCVNITSVTINDGCAIIGDNAFNSCTKLKSINIPNSVTTMGSSAFNGCTALTSATIGNGVRIIANYCFENCTALETVKMGEKLTNVNYRAFRGCNALKSVTVKNSTVPAADNESFNYFTATLYVPAAALNDYKAHALWSKFTQILPIVENLYLVIAQSESGRVKMPVTKGANYAVVIEAEEGWKVNTVTFNGTDVTEQLENGVFTTPAMYESGELRVTYESTVDAVASARLSNVKAYGAGNDIVVRGIEAGDIISVYTTDGKLVSSTPADGGEMRIGVSNGAVYIVKAGSKTLKIAM